MKQSLILENGKGLDEDQVSEDDAAVILWF